MSTRAGTALLLIAAFGLTLFSCSQKQEIRHFNNDCEKGTSYCKYAEEPINLKTYDGSNQANHPKVLYIKNGWKGYKYWMSFTPYPFMNAAFENPSVAVSNDGVNWRSPDGMKQPVEGPPRDADRGGHYSDPELVFCGDRMEMWYRYNPSRKDKPCTDNNENSILMTETKDGRVWSKPYPEFRGKTQYYSPAVLYENGEHRVWYSSKGGKLFYRECKNLKQWTKPKNVKLFLPGFSIWHQDVIKSDGEYEILFTAYKNGCFNSNNQCLYFAVSHDGINFSKPVMILSPSTNPESLDNKMIYRSTAVKIDDCCELYYSALSRSGEWHIFKTDFSEETARRAVL
ncbi:MAG TPA: hypothetical protein VHO66_00915 [Ruminiclostridium sp.]|nr:hypothetical protein [Ruminiclostridium sp.]